MAKKIASKKKPAAGRRKSPARVSNNGAATAAKPRPRAKPRAKAAPARPVNHIQRPSLVVAAATSPLSEDEMRKCKSGLTRRDLTRYRQILLQRRSEILGDVDSIQTDARNKNGGAGNLSNMPLHMADIGTDNYDQEFNLGLVENDRRIIREIDDALMRIDKGIYGVCMESGRPIGKPRLDAKPWARYCIDVARDKERRGERII